MGNDQSKRNPVKAATVKGAASKVAPSTGKATVTKGAPQSATIVAGKGVVVPRTKVGDILNDHLLTLDTVQDENKERQARVRLRHFVIMESAAIFVLSVILVLGQPLFQPTYVYYSLSPQKNVVQLAPLTEPNLTNKAVLAWAASSITEVMTFGFGDFEGQLLRQRWRFTQPGWDAFVHAFLSAQVGDIFKKNQLVLTTVPRDTPVIVKQGENDDHIYEWTIQMPIVMTYATNNNVSRQEKSIITLTILRSNESTTGIAIEKWSLGSG